MEVLFFLSSGLFLGWSLGANDAANVFGTAVGTRMVRFRTAALICSIFLVLGATISGAGAAHTLGSLGSVNAIAGSFMVALSAAATVYWMTRLRLPVSTSQAVVGAIIGWNLYSHSITDSRALLKILGTWVLCPVLAGIVAIVLFLTIRMLLRRFQLHLLRMDFLTRAGLLVVGAFGSYSLGANNIANVMGVFVPVSPFHDINLFGIVTFSGIQQLFLLGALAIAVGVFTYSHKVMATVGTGLFKMSPVAALVVVLSQSIILFIFASEGLEGFLASHGLPTIPLVPVSSSQAVVGAVIGVSLIKSRGRGVRYRVLGEISIGWVTTPLIALVISFISLFFLNNVFDQEVSKKTEHKISQKVIIKLSEEGITDENLESFNDKIYENPITLDNDLKFETKLDPPARRKTIKMAEIVNYYIDPAQVKMHLDPEWFDQDQISAVAALSGKKFEYQWEFVEELAKLAITWQLKEETTANKLFNKDLKNKQKHLDRLFRVVE
ncbi:MAG: anion permease [Candidatus Electryonea clarkiae]|nr:anion permease [Candidatus Electryonea clarkiae]MDP8285665.1 anion permease [Candidatus Electryonea clarkiae]